MADPIMSPQSRPDSSLYRAVWRWHFYAGLIVLPFLLWLAITGGLYLYKPEVEALVYRDWSSVDATRSVMPLDPMIAAVEHKAGGTVVQVMRPASPSASWRMTLRDAAGARRLAFIDPHDGTVLGTTGDGGVMQTIRNLHSLAITGPVGNAVIEIVAGWAILLVLTGLYLWWPRRGSPVIGARGRPSGRTFWRDFHASTGLIGAAVILFLALTGMPWTGIAGKQLQSYVAANGLGRPKPPAANEHDHGAAKQSLPWSTQGMAHPMGHGSGDIGAGRAAVIAAGRGLVAPWTMTLPSAPGTPYLLSATIARAQDARAIYVEAATGRVLQDARYAGFGAGARTIEWGIATHQGQQYGEPNRLVMLAGCIAIVLLALTAPLLWWKRCRNGRLEAPPRAIDRRKARGVAALMIAIGAAFPLTGASLIVALVFDLAWRQWRSVR